MKNKAFERELPSGYTEVLHINATDKKLGLIFNGIALLVMIAVMALAFIPLYGCEDCVSFDLASMETSIGFLVFALCLLLYIVAHELVHGAAYKALTGEKLTFGLSWSCAFCGVPSIYTYRRTALIALYAPLTVFSVIFLSAAAILFFVDPLYYLLVSALFAMHLGGCCGDIYVIGLLSFKFKSRETLVRDTGPEQFIYVKE